MKVASVSHIFPNAINPNSGVFVKERLKHIAQKIDLSIFAPVPSFPFIDYTSKYAGMSTIESVEEIDGLQVHHPRYFMIPKYFKFLDALFYSKSMFSFMERMTLDHEYELMDFHWVYPDAIAGLDWARKLGKKTVVTVRGNEAIYYYEKGLLRRTVQKKLNEFDHLITVSNDLKHKIVSEYNVDASKISVVSNGIDVGKFFYIEQELARKRLNLATNRQYILTVSRLSSEKGLPHLLNAFAKIKNSATELIIVGDGPLKDSLVSLGMALGINERVRFMSSLGHADICYWYNAADVFCLPSLWEGCPNVVIEALACGTPVVATQVGGIPDLVPSNDYGVLVPPGNPDSLALSLDKALAKDWNRQKISEFGSVNSWEDVADMVINIFNRVLT